jgi:hypothetical protein
MKNLPTPAEINSLFINSDPEIVWLKAASIIYRINPDFDPTYTRTVFGDVLRLFRGEYPGYGPIKTLYHDLHHTLDVFLCAVRLMHGVHVAGTHLTNDEMTLIMIAALMHDVGYMQPCGEETGTGAQHTQSHVRRGIEFMRPYILERQLPAHFANALAPMILSTDFSLKFPRIEFPDDRTRLLGKIVATADLAGQMADRTYLEKLLFLFLEFKEAHFGNFQSMHDMLCQTKKFYEFTWEKLDNEHDGMYANLAFHFKDTLGVENNYYLESIGKNIAYLSQVIALDEAEYQSMLKRGGIVEKTQTMDVCYIGT